VLRKKCYACKKEGHGSTTCPNLHYVPNVEDVIKRCLREHEKFRHSFKRNPRKRFHVLISQSHLESKALKFRMRRNTLVTNFNEHSSPQRLNKSMPEPDNSFLYPKYPTMKPENPNMLFLDEDLISNLSNKNKELKGLLRDNKEKLQHKHSLDYFPSAIERFHLHQASLFSNKQSLDEEFVFETVRNYRFYFPHNNISKIIEAQRREEEKIAKLQALKSHVEDIKLEASKILSNPATPRASNMVVPKKNLSAFSLQKFMASHHSIKKEVNSLVSGSFSERIESMNKIVRLNKKSGTESNIQQIGSQYVTQMSIGKSIFQRNRSFSYRSEENIKILDELKCFKQDDMS